MSETFYVKQGGEIGLKKNRCRQSDGEICKSVVDVKPKVNVKKCGCQDVGRLNVMVAARLV